MTACLDCGRKLTDLGLTAGRCWGGCKVDRAPRLPDPHYQDCDPAYRIPGELITGGAMCREAAPEPKPPGVTVRIWVKSNINGRKKYCWLGRCDGMRDFTILSDATFPTPEAAEADCRAKLAELAVRLFGWQAVKSLALNITFVREL